MSNSMSILKKGKGTPWRLKLADIAITYIDNSSIYQQEGIGLETYVIHRCRNYGEPCNSARHRAALAVWEAVEKMRRKPKPSEIEETKAMLRSIWLLH